MSADTAKILWGLTGSVAAVRAGQLAAALGALGTIEAVATPNGTKFLSDFPMGIRLHTDVEEWSAWKALGDPVLHIELRRWADIFVVAPVSANAMAKLAAGICDNLLLCIARAWDFSKPMVVAPAMNTHMWEHPSTRIQLDTMQKWGVRIVEPVVKKLACDDVGIGALASADAIAHAVSQALARKPTTGIDR